MIYLLYFDDDRDDYTRVHELQGAFTTKVKAIAACRKSQASRPAPLWEVDTKDAADPMYCIEGWDLDRTIDEPP